MARNYTAWYRLKGSLEKEAKLVNFRSQEIWWCALGANIGDEEDGKNEQFERPVLILRKYNKGLFLGLPLTSTLKTAKFYYHLRVDDVDRAIILSQGRTLSVYRLLRRIYKVNDNDFAKIEQAYIGLTLEKTISADKSAESRVPNGSLYYDSSKQKQNSQEEGGGA